MRKILDILFIALVTLSCVTLNAQMTTRPGMQFNVQSSTGVGPKFTVLGITTDELSKYNATDVVVGDKVYVLDGSECYELTVDSILTAAGAILEARLHDSTGVLSSVTTGQGAIVSPYTTRNVPFIPSGLRNDLASCILQKIASTVNVITGGGASTTFECRDTLTQTAHDFVAGDVVFWDENNSEYVDFTGNYSTASWPVYVVLSAPTVNTFIGVTCGIIDEDFSLPEGLYYATNTGLSLTPEDVEYPVLKVYDGKAQVLAFPGLEFDATGKPLFDVLTSTGNHNFFGGETLPLISDSIAVSLDTVAGVAVDNLTEALVALENATPLGVVIGSGTVNAVPKFTDTDEIGNSGAVTNNDNFHFPERVTIGSTTLSDTSTVAPLVVKSGGTANTVQAEFRNSANSIRHRFSSSTGAPTSRYDIGDYGTSSATAVVQQSTELSFEPAASGGGSLFMTNISRYLRTSQWYSNINGFFLKDGTQTGWRTGTAVFQIDNTTKGFLGPRMTTAQRTAISVAAADAGLEVFDTDFAAKMVYDGTRWTGFRYNGTKFQGFDGTNWVDLN